MPWSFRHRRVPGPFVGAARVGATLALVGCVTGAGVDEGASARHTIGDGLGAWLLVNQGPSLLEFTDEGSLRLVCETVPFRAVFDDVDGTTLSVLWEVFGPRNPDGTTGPLEHSSTDVFTVPPAPVLAELAWVCPSCGTFDILLGATDDQGAASSFTTVMQCSEPFLGNCEHGSPPVPIGAIGCDPADWVALEPICFAERLGPAPSCDTLCFPVVP